jgi:hypothetical protein
MVRGWGYMDGWAPCTQKDVGSDPKWDIYTFGVTLWVTVLISNSASSSCGDPRVRDSTSERLTE